MIDIAIYRVRIGSYNPKNSAGRRRSSTIKFAGGITINTKTGKCIGGLQENGVYLILLYILYMIIVMYFAAISMSIVSMTAALSSQIQITYQLILSLPMPGLIFVQYVKLWLAILLCRIYFKKVSKHKEFKFSKRHTRILTFVGYGFCIINFLLIAIVNPGLLNPGPANLSVYYQNIQGFIPFKELHSNNPSFNFTKLLEFQNYVSITKTPIIVLNETWLKPSISDSEIFPNKDYKVFRVDRSTVSHPIDTDDPSRYKRNGGGVLIAIRSELDVKSEIVKLKCNAEILTIKISDGNGNTFYLSTLYRVGTLGRTNHLEIDRYLNSLYRLRKGFVKVFLVGDLNLRNADWSTSASTCGIEQNFIDTFDNLGLSQLIRQPTHKNGNILDILLTNSDQSINNINILDKDSTIRSDHFPITFDIVSNVKRKKPVKRKIFSQPIFLLRSGKKIIGN